MHIGEGPQLRAVAVDDEGLALDGAPAENGNDAADIAVFLPGAEDVIVAQENRIQAVQVGKQAGILFSAQLGYPVIRNRVQGVLLVGREKIRFTVY